MTKINSKHHTYFAEIDKTFEEFIQERDKDIAANREAATFEEILSTIYVHALMNVFYDDRPRAWDIEIETPEDEALELAENRILDAYTLESESFEDTTTSKILERIRFFFSETFGYSDAEKDLLKAHPEVEKILETYYADFRIIEELFRKHESQLGI